MNAVTPKLTPIQRISKPLQAFLNNQSSSSILLMSCAVIALVLANGPWASSFAEFIHTYLGVQAGDFGLKMSFQHAVNDALMAIFFLFVGLEIKRELLTGELSQRSQALLPLICAFGGMLVPAAIFATLNAGQIGSRGWAIPMATDIAFALSVLVLLRDRVPTSLRIFLSALAIIDDLGAIIVIAVFYTQQLNGAMLGGAAIVLGVMALMNYFGVRRLGAYWIFFWILWYFIFKSGVHATVAGVLTAFMVPAVRRINAKQFIASIREMTDEVELKGDNDEDSTLNHDQEYACHSIESMAKEATPPLHRLEHTLGPWVSFGIMPLFAFVNSGVSFAELPPIEGAKLPLLLGIAFGLLIGKPLGIWGFAWLGIKLKWIQLPESVTLKHIFGAGLLAGIGFTMSLFIAQLSFSDQGVLNIAKIAIFAGSLLSGLLGYFYLRKLGSPRVQPTAGT